MPEHTFEYNKINLKLSRYSDGSVGLSVLDRRDGTFKIYRLLPDGSAVKTIPGTDTKRPVNLVTELRAMQDQSEAEWLKTHPNKPAWG